MEKYEKIKVVGRGAFGIVHLCQRKEDQKLLILKQIPVEQMTKEERQAAQNECQVLKLLNHPNIIEYYDNFLAEKALIIAMEYAPGGTMADYIQKRGSSLLDEETIMNFFVQIVLALHHVHTNQILHRDLKTQNILLDKHQVMLKIGDFGISKILSSKSKAYTVVGTPCYISPELCEGKPYNQKSDVWALGCVLYELCSLKRAFEAENLPALVLKIMRGNFSPISDRYSDALRSLIVDMLNLDPRKRPNLGEILARPICMKALFHLYTTTGSFSIRSERPMHTFPKTLQQSVHGTFLVSSTPFLEHSILSPLLSVVYMWGGDILYPLQLPVPNADIVQVALGRTQRTGITKAGKLIGWEQTPSGVDRCLLPGAVDSSEQQFSFRFVDGLSGVTMKQIACGDLFTVCLTDRGIIMTYGSGSSGCLGHGNYKDVNKPKMLEALLGYEVVSVSCGVSHVMAVTNEREVYSWGRGDNGRLGLGSREAQLLPTLVPIALPHEPCSVHCGVDCSAIILTNGSALVCGSNRYNKLGLDIDSDESSMQEVHRDEVLAFCPIRSSPLPKHHLVQLEFGTAHAVALTDSGECYTFGSNKYGQLGRFTARDGQQPRHVSTLGDEHICRVSCGDSFTIAVSTDGDLYTWGNHARGRLGRPADEPNTPRKVSLPETQTFSVVSISSRHSNSLLVLHRLLV
uniref:serine/threonine-protein kinase Nek8 n=1 Tax=Myxine glutinosa TaxID=7769 RepID=UPI00358F840F